MALLQITFFLCFATTLTISSMHHEINSSTDEILHEMSNYLNKKTLEKTVLPDFGISGAPIFLDVSLTNLSTIHRTGDSEIWAEGSLLKIKMEIGLEQMIVHVGNCPAMKGSADLEIIAAQADIQVSLHPSQESCTASWDSIKINNLGKIIIHTSDKTYDGQVIQGEMADKIIAYYENLLNRDDIPINIHLVSKYVELCSFQETVNTYNKFKQ